MASPLQSADSWRCFLCWKWNDQDSTHCGCCRRERTYGPKSLIHTDQTKPLALHGLETAQFPFRSEQLATMAETGLNLTAEAINGWTALHCASRFGQDGVVVSLLAQESVRHSASLEAASAGGWRALHHAVYCGHLRVVEELLLAGVDENARLNEVEMDGLTPVHLAAQQGHTAVLDLLLQCGADPLVRTSSLDRTALHLAVADQHVACARLLCAKAGELVISVDRDGISPLQQAYLLSVSSPNREVLIHLLDETCREYAALAGYDGSQSPMLSGWLCRAIPR